MSTLSENGLRTSFQLDVMRVLWSGPTKVRWIAERYQCCILSSKIGKMGSEKEKVLQVALWDTEKGIRTQSSYPESVKKELENLMASKVFNVTTILVSYRSTAGYRASLTIFFHSKLN